MNCITLSLDAYVGTVVYCVLLQCSFYIHRPIQIKGRPAIDRQATTITLQLGAGVHAWLQQREEVVPCEAGRTHRCQHHETLDR